MAPQKRYPDVLYSRVFLHRTLPRLALYIDPPRLLHRFIHPVIVWLSKLSRESSPVLHAFGPFLSRTTKANAIVKFAVHDSCYYSEPARRRRRRSLRETFNSITPPLKEITWKYSQWSETYPSIVERKSAQKLSCWSKVVSNDMKIFESSHSSVTFQLRSSSSAQTKLYFSTHYIFP